MSLDLKFQGLKLKIDDPLVQRFDHDVRCRSGLYRPSAVEVQMTGMVKMRGWHGVDTHCPEEVKEDNGKAERVHVEEGWSRSPSVSDEAAELNGLFESNEPLVYISMVDQPRP